MNKTIIALVITVVALVTTTPASAERTYEKKTNVVRLVVKTKHGTSIFFREWAKPAVTLIKTCNGIPTHECVYEVKGSKEIFLYRYEASDLTFPLYKFEFKLATNN